jgi:hypothetical protein
MNNIVHTQTFTFNPEANSGESLSLTTKFIDNGYGELYAINEITLQSYCNSATFTLHNVGISPEICRLLARSLEMGLETAKAKIAK